MPRKRCSRSPPAERRSDGEDEDYYLEEGRGPQEPQHRNAANARERARMRVLSKAFCRLKTTLPWVPADTKLSKLDTLRLAASYIAHLRALLHDEPRAAAQMFPHPLNLAWPFTFQHGSGGGGATIGCSLTRWAPNSEAASTPAGMRSHLIPKESQDYGHTPEQRTQDYPDSGYEREYQETFDSPTSSGHQYCNYVCKDNYYEVRNSYPDSLLHDT